MAAIKSKFLPNYWLFAGFLVISACAEQPAINPSLEYAAARSGFTPKTQTGIDCKLQCEQAWGKCIKSTYACDREGAACINVCADHYEAPAPDSPILENTKAETAKPASATTTQALPEAQSSIQDSPQNQTVKQETPGTPPADH